MEPWVQEHTTVCTHVCVCNGCFRISYPNLRQLTLCVDMAIINNDHKLILDSYEPSSIISGLQPFFQSCCPWSTRAPAMLSACHSIVANSTIVEPFNLHCQVYKAQTCQLVSHSTCWRSLGWVHVVHLSNLVWRWRDNMTKFDLPTWRATVQLLWRIGRIGRQPSYVR